MEPPLFRERLMSVPPGERDAWLDAVLGLGDFPDDQDLPRDCVPYVPCTIGRLLRAIDRLDVRESDVFFDVGSGVGRVAAAVHLLTGARAIGLEIQPQLAEMSRELGARIPFSTIHVDVTKPDVALPEGTIYFLYCPFGGPRLAGFLANLERIAAARSVRICCVDLTLPDRPWLVQEPTTDVDIVIYRTI